MTADVVIRGGTVVNGTGAPRRAADVAVSDGVIREIGQGLSGRRELDASGQIVTPGFVDIHTHYDAQVFWDPALSPSCWHGVTSVVAGNCGFSIAPVRPDDRALLVRTLQHVEDMSPETLFAGVPWDEFETFPQYLDAVEAHGTLINFACYVGHTAVRIFVMGEAGYERAATDDEIRRMQEVIADAMAAGAAGFATSSSPTHSGDRGRPWRARAWEEMQGQRGALPVNFEALAVAESPEHPDLIGRKVTDIATERGVNPLDVMLDVSIEENLETRFTSVLANNDPEAI